MQCIVPLPLHRQARRLSFLLQKVACPLFLFLKPLFLLFHDMKKKFHNMENILIKKKEF